MNRDDILRMAREAGAYEPTNEDDWAFELVDLERFAALVAAAERGKCGECGKASAEGWALYCVKCCEDSMVKTAVAAEREACAKVCVDLVLAFAGRADLTALQCAEAIRARGEEPKRHPGYIAGDHWLEAAYTRVCTGESEAEVMADYGWSREK